VVLPWLERNNVTDNVNRISLNKRLHESFVRLTRHSFALLGMAGLVLVLVFASQPAWRLSAGHNLISWLDARQDNPLADSVSTHADLSATSSDPVTKLALTEEQQAITRWLSRRYKLSPEPLGGLVAEAWAVGDRIQVSPTLLLAVMAIESRFNPFASSTQGGIGLMQIEPNAQHLALLPFGGPLAAFDPLTNLRVGARYLQTLIAQSTSVEAALQLYAAGSGQPNVAEYAIRVLAKQQQLESMTRNAQGIEVAQNSRL
jgi:soluble lytic murein transglycosylase-like protein